MGSGGPNGDQAAGGRKAGRPGLWRDAGIASTAEPWPLGLGICGTALGLGLLAAAFPLLLAFALLSTLLESLRCAAGLDSRAGLPEREEGSDKDVTLVIPGTCGYIFWQMGMMQYICENFETSRLKLTGVSSGAVCAALMLRLEEAASGAASGEEAAQRVRDCVQQIFELLDRRLTPVLWWPMGFLGRLGLVLDDLGKYLAPSECPGDGRIRVGTRRLAGGALPALVPDVVAKFQSAEEFIATVQASSCVWLIVRPKPLFYLRHKAGYFCDGVNPFSLFCGLEYLLHLRSGLAAISAPRHITSGGLDMIYAIWNCGVMGVALPRRGQHVWVTPTLGGRLNVLNLFRFSGWFMAEQWRQGYVHAHDLDLDGHWQALQRRASSG